jgi:hypothetical protein
MVDTPCTKLEHYRWISEIPSVPFPKLSSLDNELRADTKLIDALKNSQPAQPFALIVTNQSKSLQQLADIFHHSLPLVDTTMLVSLITLASERASAYHNQNWNSNQTVPWLLCTTWKDAKFRSLVSGTMILRVHSDTSYLSEYNARSWSGGRFLPWQWNR